MGGTARRRWTDTFYRGSDTFGWYEYRVTPSIYDYDTGGYVYGSAGSVSVLVTKVAYPPSLPRSVTGHRDKRRSQSDVDGADHG